MPILYGRVQERMREPVRWGILGNAWIARDFMIPALGKSELCSLFTGYHTINSSLYLFNMVPTVSAK